MSEQTDMAWAQQVDDLRDALELICTMLDAHAGEQSILGDVHKVADAALWGVADQEAA